MVLIYGVCASDLVEWLIYPSSIAFVVPVCVPSGVVSHFRVFSDHAVSRHAYRPFRRHWQRYKTERETHVSSLCESHRVTAAATGPSTLVVQLEGRNLSILHGELMGHILALVLSSNTHPTVVPTLYSDHQNSVNLIDDIQTRVS